MLLLFSNLEKTLCVCVCVCVCVLKPCARYSLAAVCNRVAMAAGDGQAEEAGEETTDAEAPQILAGSQWQITHAFPSHTSSGTLLVDPLVS